ncbi:MAG TPA: carboxylesterase family protein [Acidimicrobiales bacterium]|nr:carboxylesterase family protein [Acidimicrobiales bacterium]
MPDEDNEGADGVEVTTPAGRVRGRRTDGGFLFAGVPFAEPPLGDLRLAPPVPVRPWGGTRSCLSFPAPPAQPAGMVEGSEDCLYLNVWTPSLTGSLPVVVWVYGGGFEGGSASPPFTDGASLARGLQAVTVALNYRVGALGFLRAEDGANVGIRDVIQGLEWVRTSVSAFGGDPARVTVMGQSAGAFIIGALLGAPAATDLFHRAILQSGSTGRVFSAETADAVRAALFARLDVTSLTELRRLPARAIIEAQGDVIDQDIGRRNLPGGRSWGTVLDGQLLPEHPHDVVARGGARDIPLLLSTTRDEVQFWAVLQPSRFAPGDDAALVDEMLRAGVEDPDQLVGSYREAAPGATLARLRSRFLSDYIYRWPAQQLARAQAASGGAAYLAEFTSAPLGEELGACHACELTYLFDTLGPALTVPDTPENRALKDEIYAAWRSFVHTGVADWPPVQADDPLVTIREFGPRSTSPVHWGATWRSAASTT